MYSSKISAMLKKAGISIGDRVRVEKGGQTHEGILMPRAGESDELVIKLDSGYNIGISSAGATLSQLEKAPKKAEPAPEHYPRGEIAILGCGGTVLSKVEYKTGAAFPAFSPKDLFNAFPKLKHMASVHSKILFQLLSEDMHSRHWSVVAQEVANEIRDGAKGVIVMHGTDTLHYTSAALSFALANLPVPVVVMGAQRSSDRPSSDNESNILNSILVAKSDLAHVGVCMHANSNDDYAFFHLGTKVRKMHTSRRDAFRSINTMPLAKVDHRNGTVEPLMPYQRRDEKRKLDLQNHFSQNVGMLYSHPGIKPELVSKFADYDGLVLVGTGLGHVPTNAFNDKLANNLVPSLKSLIDSGIPVVMSSQTIYGRINMGVYTAGRILQDIGVIGNGADWTPETAFVKLSWVLGKEKKMEKVKELMMKNIAGEITPRSNYEETFIDF
ncbi:MAG: Glu-tRNA(Gln) amidotransferase subunit GatD [Candidatus ainarchaeum sp.]|nr:Glu-tRNA(Gln) amidotransferase subunit GatD [Candidatus ainarchaeum sp.]